MDHLFIPLDWKLVTLNTEKDPNLFGEALRGWAFIGTKDSVGCYDTFEVNSLLKEVKSGKIYKEAMKLLCPEFRESIKVYHLDVKEEDCYLEFRNPDGKIIKEKFSEPYEIVVAWYWDGDGVLYFRYNNRKVVNDDCKKDHYWEWVN